MHHHSLTLWLLVSSADNLCKQFGPRSGSTKDTDSIPEKKNEKKKSAELLNCDVKYVVIPNLDFQ